METMAWVNLNRLVPGGVMSVDIHDEAVENSLVIGTKVFGRVVKNITAISLEISIAYKLANI